MNLKRLVAFLAASASGALAVSVQAQTAKPARTPVGASRVGASQAAPTSAPASSNLRARFGIDSAARLLRSTDPEERLRGLEHAAATHTPEALSLLVRAGGVTVPGGDPRAPIEGVTRKDPRALLVVVRGLARWTEKESARDALEGLLETQTQAFTAQVGTSADPATSEAVGLERIRLARQEAAIALASSGHPATVEKLLAAGRSGGPAQEPALEAMALFPPDSAVLAGVTLTTPGAIGLAAATGDLRSLDAIEGVLAASDPAVRAAGLAALGLAGDWRVRTAARESLGDPNPHVRIAAGDALARLGAPEAAAAIEALITDESTAREGLKLAHLVQSPGVVRAAAARAAATSDDDTRSAAVTALGQQLDGLAVEALMALANDPRLAGDAIDALARSAANGAGQALERLAAARTTRKLALRAYLVRSVVGDAHSVLLDRVLDQAAASADPVERAVATQALVALGRKPLVAALADPDERVQRAAAMGALFLPASTRRRLAEAGLPVVRDAAASAVLAFVVDAGDDDGPSAPGTQDLLDRARGGRVDAPLAAMALARRQGDEVDAEVDALLASSDPILRAHVARGLGASSAPDATGRLAHAYAFEIDTSVRRAVIRAMASRTTDADSPSRQQTLSLAARLDPDRIVRWLAAHAEATPPVETVHRLDHQVAWVRLLAAEGAAVPPATMGTVTGADGVARPIVFDDDGYALVGGLPPGEARLRLASRVTPYNAPSAP